MKTRKAWRWLLVASIPAVLVAWVMCDPFLRQSIFGPKIQGIPMVVWQRELLEDLDPQIAQSRRDSIARRMMAWLGVSQPERSQRALTDNQFMRVLEDLFANGSPREKIIAASVLIIHKEDEDCGRFETVLLEGIQSPDLTLRRGVINGFRLGLKPHPNLQSVLKVALTDRDDYVRIEAAEAIFKFSHDKDGLSDIVRRLTRESERTNVVRAARIILEIQNTDAVASDVLPKLANWLKSSDPKIRGRGILCLGLFGKRSKPWVPHILRLEATSDDFERSAVYRALAKVQPEEETTIRLLASAWTNARNVALFPTLGQASASLGRHGAPLLADLRALRSQPDSLGLKHRALDFALRGIESALKKDDQP